MRENMYMAVSTAFPLVENLAHGVPCRTLRAFGPAALQHSTAANPMFPLAFRHATLQHMTVANSDLVHLKALCGMLRVFGPATLLHLTAANPMFPLVRAPTSPVWNVARLWACDAPALNCCKLRHQSFVHLKALCGMLCAFRHATLQHLTAANLLSMHLQALCGMLRAFWPATLRHLTANPMFPLVRAPTL
jgi:hypothetical protein